MKKLQKPLSDLLETPYYKGAIRRFNDGQRQMTLFEQTLEPFDMMEKAPKSKEVRTRVQVGWAIKVLKKEEAFDCI